MQIGEWAYNRVLSLARLRGGEPVAAEAADVLTFAKRSGCSFNTNRALGEALDPKYSYDTLAQVLYPHATPASQKAAEVALSRFELAHLLQETPTFGAASYAKPKDFDEVTQAVPNRDTILAQGEERKIAATRLSYWLETGNFSAIKEQYRKDMDELAHDALIAFSQGKIDTNSYTTSLTFWALYKEYREEDVGILPLFTPDGEIDPQTREKLSKDRGVFSRNGLTNSQWEQFDEKMKNLPQSEQYIFTIPFEEDRDQMDVEQVLYHSIFLNTFNRYTEGGKTRRMVPPLGVMQSYLDVRFPERVTITPYMGVSPIERIEENGKTDTRDMAWTCPGMPPPSTADGFSTKEKSDIFRFHDWYHALLVSHIPSEDRKLFAAIAGQLRVLGIGSNDYTENLYHSLIDMEFPQYTDSFPDVKERLFSCLSACLEEARKRLRRPLSPQEEGIVRAFGESSSSLWKDRVPAKERLPYLWARPLVVGPLPTQIFFGLVEESSKQEIVFE